MYLKLTFLCRVRNGVLQVPKAVPSYAQKVFCNRTLNMRSIRAIGYDMDYTLIHYRVEQWERRAYEYLKQAFVDAGWPLESYQFDSEMVCRGLVIDTLNGNLLKPNRFGFVKRAVHGTEPLHFEAQRQMYSRTIIDLADRRWVFLNTLFSLSEGCMYAQLVDIVSQGKSPKVIRYSELYEEVRLVLEAAHLEGKLKAEIIADPEKYVILEPEVALALLDQYHTGKKLMLITNSEWSYTVPMMSYSFDCFLPKGMSWRDLFDVVVVGARKPLFFMGSQPFFEVATEDGLLRPSTGPLKKGVAYFGGSAQQVEKSLGLSGDEILYVGDHMFGDVHVTKNVLRWRTALILRELENELIAVHEFKKKELELVHWMAKKEELEGRFCQVRLQLQRVRLGYGLAPEKSDPSLEKQFNQLRLELEEMDRTIAPLAVSATHLSNPTWGLLMRAGNDKSYLAYQMERYADVYTSRVANLLTLTPFGYLRSPRGSLSHDP